MNNRNLFCVVLEAGKSKVKALVNLMSGESALSGPWDIFLGIFSCILV